MGGLDGKEKMDGKEGMKGKLRKEWKERERKGRDRGIGWK